MEGSNASLLMSVGLWFVTRIAVYTPKGNLDSITPHFWIQTSLSPTAAMVLLRVLSHFLLATMTGGLQLLAIKGGPRHRPFRYGVLPDLWPCRSVASHSVPRPSLRAIGAGLFVTASSTNIHSQHLLKHHLPRLPQHHSRSCT
jgi:hypothetical protein